MSSTSQVAAKPIAWGNAIAPGADEPVEGLLERDDGDAEPRLFVEELLDGVDLFGRRARVGIAPDLEPEDAVLPDVPARAKIAGDHEQLAELLLGGHPGDEVVDPPVDRKGWIAIGRK